MCCRIRKRCQLLSRKGGDSRRQRFCATSRPCERSERDRRSIRELCAKAWGAFFLRRRSGSYREPLFWADCCESISLSHCPLHSTRFVMCCRAWICWASLSQSRIGRLANHALWPLNGFELPSNDLEISRLNNIIGAISPSVRFFLGYEKEKRQVFMEASRFEFYLENGSRIITDLCLTGMGDEAGPPSERPRREAGFPRVRSKQ